ncbi:hypothetical protein [Halobellus limi]|uniref:Uncharacterized protein n=1 Tax=Halobellus limi TaxID=699433 RepID=A0A1H5WPQ0_9EURY|nr:hypothetical protein [Halobellus limi]QCC46372.1 hypothetical protein DV707_01025 [Halobellus limi]SEG01472.1 hypothetical protein SAMN04488133_1355 [Halobellus limi]
MIVSAVAFVAGALCLYYGERDLRTRRAIRRLKRRRDARPERGARSDASSGRTEPSPAKPPDDPADDVAIERGFVLLALGGLCLLFGILAL